MINNIDEGGSVSVRVHFMKRLHLTLHWETLREEYDSEFTAVVLPKPQDVQHALNTQKSQFADISQLNLLRKSYNSSPLSHQVRGHSSSQETRSSSLPRNSFDVSANSTRFSSPPDIDKKGSRNMDHFESDSWCHEFGTNKAILGESLANKSETNEQCSNRQNSVKRRFSLDSTLSSEDHESPLNVHQNNNTSAEELDDPLFFVLEVADTGHGVPAESLPTMFDAYKQVLSTNIVL